MALPVIYLYFTRSDGGLDDWRAPGKSQEKNLTFFRQNSPIPIKAGFLYFNKLCSPITFSDIRILALQVKNPVHNVRLWHTGMTRSLEYSRIRAPWSHNQGIRTDKVGNLH
jgi:hypothetical protein